MRSSEEKEEEQMLRKDEEEGPVSGGEEEDLILCEEEEDKNEEPISDVEEEEEPVCRVSQPAHPHTLSRRTKMKPLGICFAGPGNKTMRSEDYYCTTCDVEFHADCYNRPRRMTHPYHPQHPLIFSAQSPETGLIHDSHWHEFLDEEFKGVGIPGNIFDNCIWCGGNMKYSLYIYRCSICNFCLCSNCSETFPLPTIQNPKSHHHSLIFLPRPLLIPCDACGLVERSDPSYACFQCNYVVHKSCIDLPRVIKLTRHLHRLSYRPLLSPKISPCRLCYKTVDVKYGHYSCNHDDCSYVVHSKCATNEKVWDGRELEWEPEELDEAEDVAPFKKVGDDLIKYFCHEHHLKLDKYDAVRDGEKQCQACILHIDSRDFYSCVQCDFFLHEVCANLPRKLDHALHNHSLVLDQTPPQDYETAGCLVCKREFAGFVYKCSRNSCDDGNRYGPSKVQVDVGCIIVPDCFTHRSHEHPLFIPIPLGEDEEIFCECCRLKCAGYLQCTLCQFALCFNCATIPDKLHNKYDAHNPLSLSYGEVSDETYWCEVCEKKLDPTEWFYTCDKSYITIHRKCVFGDSAYMKPGYTFYFKSFGVEVICNDSNTRPVCHRCNSRCSSYVYFKWFDEMVNCSIDCLARIVPWS